MKIREGNRVKYCPSQPTAERVNSELYETCEKLQYFIITCGKGGICATDGGSHQGASGLPHTCESCS